MMVAVSVYGEVDGNSDGEVDGNADGELIMV